MPPKKSSRTSVKAKTSVLSSTAVQVALITGGAAILAAAAAFVSVGAGRTVLTVSHLAPKRNPVVAQARSTDVPTFGLTFKASSDVELRRLTLGTLADDDGSFSPNPSNDVPLEKIVDTCVLRDLGTKTIVSGPIAPASGTVVFPLQMALKKGMKTNVQAECTVSASAPVSGNADLFALNLVKKSQIEAVSSTGATLPSTAISFGLSTTGFNPRGRHASVLVKLGAVVTPPPAPPAPPAPTAVMWCTDRDGDGYPFPNNECVTAVTGPAGFVAPRADGKTDCMDTDAEVNPGRTEVIGNVKNDDCDPATPDQAPATPPTPTEETPVVVVPPPTAPPSVTAALASGSPSGAAVPGMSEVFRFNLIVDQAGGDVQFHRLAFRLTATDGAGSGWNLCNRLGVSSKWGLRNAMDPATRLEDAGDWSFYQADGTPCADGKELGFAQVDFTVAGDRQPKYGSAGQAVTYQLRVDTSGASSINDDVARIDMPAVSTFLSLGSSLRAVSWTPSFPLNASASDVVRNLPVIGGMLVY